MNKNRNYRKRNQNDDIYKPTISGLIMETLLEAARMLPRLLPRPFETKYAWARRIRHLDPDSYGRTVRRLKQQGLVKEVIKNNQKFIKLTKSGKLEALLRKTKLDKPKEWDGRWRVLMFDIPEKSKDKRNILRRLLKKNDFYKLQASVYITPYPLNREGISYLKNSGLIEYIRILKVEEMDEDRDLLRRFNLARK